MMHPDASESPSHQQPRLGTAGVAEITVAVRRGRAADLPQMRDDHGAIAHAVGDAGSRAKRRVREGPAMRPAAFGDGFDAEGPTIAGPISQALRPLEQAAGTVGGVRQAGGEIGHVAPVAVGAEVPLQEQATEVGRFDALLAAGRIDAAVTEGTRPGGVPFVGLGGIEELFVFDREAFDDSPSLATHASPEQPNGLSFAWLSTIPRIPIVRITIHRCIAPIS